MQQLLSERIRHQVTFCLCSFYMMTFKISLIYVQGCEKRNPTHTCQHESKIRFGNSDFIDLDRISFCQAFFIKSQQILLLLSFCRALMNNFSSLVLSSIFMALILGLNNMFLGVLNPSQIGPLQVKCILSKDQPIT